MIKKDYTSHYILTYKINELPSSLDNSVEEYCHNNKKLIKKYGEVLPKYIDKNFIEYHKNYCDLVFKLWDLYIADIIYLERHNDKESDIFNVDKKDVSKRHKSMENMIKNEKLELKRNKSFDESLLNYSKKLKTTLCSFKYNFRLYYTEDYKNNNFKIHHITDDYNKVISYYSFLNKFYELLEDVIMFEGNYNMMLNNCKLQTSININFINSLRDLCKKIVNVRIEYFNFLSILSHKQQEKIREFYDEVLSDINIDIECNINFL